MTAPSGAVEATARRSFWTALAALLLLAVGLRWCFYSGFFGSDEVTYTRNSFSLLHDDWGASSYVGANRYGINLPVAFFGVLFGQNEFAAAFYSLLCSVAEVALLALLGSRLVGTRAGLLAGLLLATLPVHVHFSGRLMADAPLGLAITASFLFILDGETRLRRLSYLLAGIAAGWSFWIKPAAVIYLAVFLAYPLLCWRFDRRWNWVVLGFFVMIGANNLLFWSLTGDFWYLFKSMAAGLGSDTIERGVVAGFMHDAPWYYLEYLFIKVFHTGLLGWLALAGVVLWGLQRRQLGADRERSLRLILWWGSGLLLVLSLFIIRLNPLQLVFKQTNYMLIFVAPLCLLGGHALAQAGPRLRLGLVIITVAPALLLMAMLQASVSAFTANSMAALDFARERPQAIVFGNQNAYRAALFEQAIEGEGAPLRVRFVGDLFKPEKRANPEGRRRFAVIDPGTLYWGQGEPFRQVEDAPACWRAQGLLAPKMRGIGSELVGRLVGWQEPLPLPAGVQASLRALGAPAPAHVFEVPQGDC